MKCLLLCWILGVGAFAAQPTRVEIAYNPAQIGQKVWIRAAVYLQSGRPVSQGDMEFTADGVAIPGCEALWVYMSSGAAECLTKFPKLGVTHLVARYSGTTAYESSSATADIVVGKLDPWPIIASYPIKPVYATDLVVNARAMGATGFPLPTGTFTFFDNGKELVTRTLGTDGKAGLDLPLTAGNHVIRAVFNGDDLYVVRSTDPLELAIGKGPPVVAISSTPAQLRQPVTITASIMPTGATGTITFGGVPGCVDVPVRDAVASCRYTWDRLGTVDLTATYSGDENLTGGSASMTLNVGRVVAGMYVAAFPMTPVFGQPVTVGALALGAPGVAPPTGIVNFADGLGGGAIGVLGPDGHATWPVKLAAGLRTLSATYNGDANYGTSQGVATVVVAKAATTVTLTSAPGAPVTATVAVTAPGAGTPTGSVRFTRDGITIGTAPLAGSVATLAAAATGTLRAEYAGDLNFLGSVSAPATVTAPRVDLKVTADRNPAPAGRVTITVSATENAAATPTGTVQVSVDGTAVGGGPLVLGTVAVTAELKAGSHAVTAAYSGDAVYPASSVSMTLAVTSPAGTVALTANPQAPVYGEPITLTAQLPAGSTGTVAFADGATPLGSSAGTLTVSRLAAGTHAITASWAGDANWGAASAVLALTVGKASTTTTLSVSGGLAAARVAAVAPGSGAPTGSVRFVDGATGSAFAVVALEGGTASAATPAGVSMTVAVYAGDENFAGSTSGSASLLTAVNAASYEARGFAPDEVVTLFGPGLAGAGSATVTDGAGTIHGVDLLYSSAGQAALVLPAGLASGPGTLKVAGMATALPIARTAPGLFTADSTGRGAPAGQVAPTSAGAVDGIEVGGEGAVYLILYGTGIRHFTKIACDVGGRAATVVYAGPLAGSAGVDQVNVLLPAELRGAGRVELVVSADGVASNAVTVVFR